MAHGRFSLLDWLKSLFFTKKPREAKEEPLPIHQNDWYDPKLAAKSKSQDFPSELSQMIWSDDSILRVHTSTFTSNKVLDQNDHPMEVFLDEDGNITEPLEKGVASCSIDRWCMPDCVPGIQSTVNVSSVSGHYKPDFNKQSWPKVITVLFANDRYIHLAPNKLFYIEPEDDYYPIVEAHFTKRGIDHLSKGTSASLIDYIRHKYVKVSGNGQRTNKASTSNPGTSGWQFTDSKINIDGSQIASGLSVNSISYNTTCNIKTTWTEI